MTSVGYCFVSREDWPEYCRISVDLADGADYNTWLNSTQKFRENVIAKGCGPVQVDTKPNELLAWCKARGRDVNSRSRALYAASRTVEFDKK